MENNNNKESNTGCIVFIIIFVLGSLIWSFATTSKEDLAGGGAAVLGIGGFALAIYLLNKFFGSNNSNSQQSTSYSTSNYDDSLSSNKKTEPENDSSWKGCLAVLGCLIFIGIIVGVVTSSEELNIAVGAIVMIVIAVAMGIWMYNSSK